MFMDSPPSWQARSWSAPVVLGVGLAGLLVGIVIGRSWPGPPAPKPSAAAVGNVASPPKAAAPVPAAPEAPAGGDEAPAEASTAASTPLAGQRLTLADLAFTVIPPSAPKDRVSLDGDVLTLSAVPGSADVLGACLARRLTTAGPLGVTLEWRRQEIPAGDPNSFGRVIVRAYGEDGKVVKAGYFPLDRGPGSSDWKPVASTLDLPTGTVSVNFCLEIAAPTGRVELRGLELSGASS